MVYTALTNGIAMIAVLALSGGLWFDSLSLNPMGASVLPLLVIGMAILMGSRDLLMPEHRFAQVVLRIFGGGVSAAGNTFHPAECRFPRRCWDGFRCGNGSSWLWPGGILTFSSSRSLIGSTTRSLVQARRN